MLIIRTKYNPLLYPVCKSQTNATAKLSFHLPFNVMNEISAKAAIYVPGELVPEIIKSVSLKDFERINDCVFIHPAMKEKYEQLLKLLTDRVTDCSKGNRNIPIIAQKPVHFGNHCFHRSSTVVSDHRSPQSHSLQWNNF